MMFNMTLHIIGNGFDRHHDMPTEYSDFCKYAWSHTKDKGYYLGLLETVYPKTNISTGRLELWSNLEKALGEPDFKATFEETTEDIELEEGHEGRFQAQKEDAPEYFLRDMFDVFHKIFREWMESVEISDEPSVIPEFDPQGLFLSFNYTETLESLYGIPREKINYIHGRRNSKDELIVGHNNDLDGRDYLSEDPMIYEYRAYDVIADVINDERKRVSDILNYNHQYWTTLRDVNKVVVYGHSLSGVDLPYFLKIKEYIQPNAEWHFSIHFENSIQKDSELNKINNFIAEVGINKANCHTFNF